MINDKPKYIERQNMDLDSEDKILYAKKYIKELFDSQQFGVLSTVVSEQPFNSLIAFANNDNLKYIYFATPKKTRKYKTILANNNISLLVDNRSSQLDSINEISVVTVIGKAEVIEEDRREGIDILKKKHPNLDEFINSYTTGIIRIRVEQYYCISNFQEVFEWQP